MRFTHQQPQYDQFQQMSNFFPDQWSAGAGADALHRRLQQRRGDLLGQRAQRDGSAHRPDPDGAGRGQQRRRPSARRFPAPAIRSTASSQAGDGIAKTGYTWPKLVVGPRFGVAYDLTGQPDDRSSAAAAACSTTVPTATRCSRSPATRRSRRRRTCATASCRRSARASARVGSPALTIFQYDAKVPASWQWKAGVQMALPWAIRRGRLLRRQPRLQPPRRFQGGNRQPERGRHRRRLPAAEPGPDARHQHGPGRTRIRQPAAAYHGSRQHQPATRPSSGTRTTRIQTSLNRRFRNGFSFGVNYAYGISFKGNTGLSKRLPARRRRHHHRPRRPGGVREAEREPRPSAAHRSRRTGCGTCRRCPPSIGRVSLGYDPQRLAALGRVDGRFGRGLRPRLQLHRTTAAA